jgi:hypothetical protein
MTYLGFIDANAIEFYQNVSGSSGIVSVSFVSLIISKGTYIGQ